MLGYVILMAIFNIIAHVNDSFHKYIKDNNLQTSKWWLLLLISPYLAGMIEVAITLKPPILSAGLIGWTIVIFYDYCEATVKAKILDNKIVPTIYKDLATLILTLYAIPAKFLQGIGAIERRY